jgi:anti-sigma factor RsiW
MHTILNQNLEQYLEGRLPAELQATVDTHLTECKSCQAELDEMFESRDMLKLLAVSEDDPALEPAPGFAVKVLANIEATGRTAPWWAFFPKVRELAVAGALLALLASGYGFTLHASAPSTTAQLLVDWPAYREAPAQLFAHHHDANQKGMCMQCWQESKKTSAISHNDGTREAAFATLVTNDDAE